MSEAGDIPVGYIQKNARERIRATWREYEGARFLDIRLVVMSDDAEYKPTKKGITIRPGFMAQFIQMMVTAERVAKANGILDGVPTKSEAA